MSRNTFGPLNQASFILSGKYLRDYDTGTTDLAESIALKSGWEDATGEDLEEYAERIGNFIKLRRCPHVNKYTVGTFEFDLITQAVGFCIATHLKMRDLREWMKEASRARSLISDIISLRGDVMGHQREIEELKGVKIGWFMSLFSDNEKDITHLESLIERDNSYLAFQTKKHQPTLDTIQMIEAQILDRIEEVRTGNLAKTVEIEEKDWKNCFFN